MIKDAIHILILFMCESSEGSGKTACILSLVCVLTERICCMDATANNHNNSSNHALEPTSVAATIRSGMQVGCLNIFYFIEYAF